MPLTIALLNKLDKALLDRQASEGFRLLDRAGVAADDFDPHGPHAASFLLSLAQWVDLGYRDHHLIDRLVARFAGVDRAEMKLADFIRLRIAEAFQAFASEDADTAISILERVLAIQFDLTDSKQVFVAHYWKGRAHRQKGEYELAMRHILEAKKTAQQLHAPRLVAVVEIHESWMLFQRGRRKEAFRLLDDAERELKQTGHDLSLGNIASARGRYVRRSGEYAKALEHFQQAIAIYSRHSPQHSNLARALVNAAYVKRLIAIDLSHSAREGRARGVQHDRYLRICADALDLLHRAGEIYALNHHRSGSGSVLVNAGHLHLDRDDIDRASEEAAKAFALGQVKHDVILMSRARTLQAAIKNKQVEEQVGEAEDIASFANAAAQFADEAIAFAQQTQNKRLLAGAYIARGSTAANDFFEDWESAKQFSSVAGDLLSPDDRDHLSKELAVLKSRILRAIGIDETLRSWSDGLTGEKTFQQVTEEFAEIVIPKVWLRENRNISRVAAKLSISPKKVRRILRSVKLLR
jgi:tetratricopeptide (TPR) repeat protein